MKTDQVFKDLRVVELASVLAGPAVGMFFAELGARVIKIENKTTGGDVTRNWKLPQEKTENISSYYHSVNWNKQSLFLNLSTEEDKSKAYSLIKEADLVISNFRKLSARKLGFDYEMLCKINKNIILGEISAYGNKSDLPGFDAVIQAQTGWMSINGQADGPPTKLPVALMDLLAAHQLKEGLLVALINRYKNGKGSHVQVSLFDSAIASLANQASNYLNTGTIPSRSGSEHPNIAPYGDLVSTADGMIIMLSIGTEKQFREFCKVINRSDLSTNPGYDTNKSRVRNRAALILDLQKTISNITSDLLLEECEKLFIPVAPILSLDKVLETTAARELIISQKEKSGEISKRVRTAVFKFV